mmetsp:Transcript_3446/g.5832  ORF Transcript_3446/g.5832 Transcript_3446/m.5832 type:complete len:85 (+) Transcript_3446:89-343(+)
MNQQLLYIEKFNKQPPFLKIFVSFPSFPPQCISSFMDDPFRGDKNERHSKTVQLKFKKKLINCNLFAYNRCLNKAKHMFKQVSK